MALHTHNTHKSRSNKSSSDLSRKISKISHEEAGKPKGKRLSHKAVVGKAAGILKSGRKK